MRIAFVVHEFPPTRILGGTGRHAADVARSLQRLGHEVQVFAFQHFSPQFGEYDDTYEGIPVRRVVPTVPSLSETIQRDDIEYAFERWLAENPVDLVHFHHTIILGMGLPLVAKRQGLPVLMSLHDYWLTCHRAHLTYPTPDDRLNICTPPVRREACAKCMSDLYQIPDRVSEVQALLPRREQLAKQTLAACDRILCLSNFARNLFETDLAWPGRYVTLRSGIEPFEPIARPRLSNGVPTFGFIGNIAPIKGLEIALEAFRSVASEARFLVFGDAVGETPYVERIRKLASGLPNVTFFGGYERSQLPRIFSLMDALIIPSWLENYPLAALEAQMAQLPVIASDVGGLPEIISHGRNGLLYEVGNSAALAVHMKALVEQPGLLSALRGKITPPLLLHEHVIGLIEHYKAVLAEHGRHRSIANAPKLRGPASVVIVTYNSAATIEACVASVLDTLNPTDEVIVVDNASQDRTPEVLQDLARQDQRVRVLQSSRNVGFSAGTNLGIQHSTGDYVVMLNPDTIVYGEWLEQMARVADQANVGAVGPLSDYVAGRQKWQLYLPIDQASDSPPSRLAAMTLSRNRDQAVESKLLIGFCLLIRRDVLDKVGWLDRELFLGNDDLDMSWRLRREGYRLMVATGAFVHHIGQVSFNTEPSERTKRLVQESTDLLARKLVNHYGPGRVPSAFELWEMDWFHPSEGILEGKLPAPALPSRLPEAKGYNIILAEAAPDRIQQTVRAYLEAFSEEDDVSLHLFAGNQITLAQEVVLGAIAAVGTDPEHVPDISILDVGLDAKALPRILALGDLVLGHGSVAKVARAVGKPALEKVTPKRLQVAKKHFPALEWQAPPLEIDTPATERWLVPCGSDWQGPLAAFLRTHQSGDGAALLIGVRPTHEVSTQVAISDWLVCNGHDPMTIPDVCVVGQDLTDVSLFRSATGWIENGNDVDQTIADAVGCRKVSFSDAGLVCN